MARKHWAAKAWQALRGAPIGVRLAAPVLACLVLWLLTNALVQLARKPTEILFPVSGALERSPAETWSAYGRLFREHSTASLTPDFLAALAQIEGGGNPLARTAWRWRLAEDPFEVYRPASSAVGMFQITDGTLRLARRFCIHDHAVVADGPWYDWRSCWFNALYLRVLPGDATEMTAAFLDHHVARVAPRAARRQQQDLAAVMHLCGVVAGEAFARNGLRPAPRQSCGGQDVAAYLAQLHALQRTFAALSRRRHRIRTALHGPRRSGLPGPVSRHRVARLDDAAAARRGALRA